MFPSVRVPKGVVARPVDLKLKRGWRYDEVKRVLVSNSGTLFTPSRLPKGTRIAYKVPSLARLTPARLSKAERDLQRYMQVVLPVSLAPEKYLKTIQAWPCVEEARVAPEVSLPRKGY